MKTLLPDMRIGSNSTRQVYLYAFAQQAEVYQYIRTQSVSDDAEHLNKIISEWQTLQQKVALVIERETGLADTIAITRIPAECVEQANAYVTHELFQKTFHGAPISIEMVEIDKLVAAQRIVYLEYADRIAQSLSGKPTANDIAELCLSPTRVTDTVQHMEQSPGVHIFSSTNTDVRFLGAYLKPVTAEDLQYCEGGGIPTAAIVAFIGYGAAPVNVLRCGTRVVLNNGYHRLYALRRMGITHAPVVMQHINDKHLAFPPHVAGVPKDYLLDAPRPVMMKDFFELDFTITLNVRRRMRTVMTQVGVNQLDVPF